MATTIRAASSTPNGNLNNWWTPEDSANYDKRGDCIAQEYTQDVPEAVRE